MPREKQGLAKDPKAWILRAAVEGMLPEEDSGAPVAGGALGVAALLKSWPRIVPEGDGGQGYRTVSQRPGRPLPRAGGAGKPGIWGQRRLQNTSRWVGRGGPLRAEGRALCPLLREQCLMDNQYGPHSQRWGAEC